MVDADLRARLERRRCREVDRRLIPGCVQMVVFVAAGFSLRRTGETPVPPRKVGRKIFDWSPLGISPLPPTLLKLFDPFVATVAVRRRTRLAASIPGSDGKHLLEE